jgi:hypothetical protein
MIKGRWMMENTDRLDNYLVLLKIRRKAFRRDTLFIGGLLFIAFLATTGTLLFTEWNVRSIWLMGVMDVLFTITFFMTWARYQITIEKIDLINNLRVP